jgi:hypothetical protein
MDGELRAGLSEFVERGVQLEGSEAEDPDPRGFWCA